MSIASQHEKKSKKGHHHSKDEDRPSLLIATADGTDQPATPDDLPATDMNHIADKVILKVLQISLFDYSCVNMAVGMVLRNTELYIYSVFLLK